MKRLISIAVFIAIASVAFAQPGPHGAGHGRMGLGMMGLSGPDRDGRVLQTVNTLLREYEDRTIDSFTIGEIRRIAAVLSVPAQEAAYIRRVGIASRFVPGAGQFINGDSGSGALFLAGDLALTAGSLVAMHFVLPEAVRFDQLDYFNTPAEQIKTTWERALENLTLSDALPIIGVSAGSMLLRSLLGKWSADLARERASRLIQIGEIEFEARPMLLLNRQGLPGLGLQMRF